jgi:hypothetical protein
MIHFSELDEFKNLDILDEYWALVRFSNYTSSKLVDLFTSTKIMLNSEHPFTKLLIKHISLIMADEELHLRVKLFFKSFGYHNYHYDMKELTGSQKKVLERLVTKHLLSEDEASQYLISEPDLPMGETEWHFGL